MSYNTLNEKETFVILEKGTERAFSGHFWDHDKDGIYICRQCETPLFSSEAKFDSGTGYPSFNHTVENAVKVLENPDANCAEIVCNTCDGHLGHICKEGEMAPYHCINSVALDFKHNI